MTPTTPVDREVIEMPQVTLTKSSMRLQPRFYPDHSMQADDDDGLYKTNVNSFQKTEQVNKLINDQDLKV